MYSQSVGSRPGMFLTAPGFVQRFGISESVSSQRLLAAVVGPFECFCVHCQHVDTKLQARGGLFDLICNVSNVSSAGRSEEKLNKKVLLQERKRHTTRRVASARYSPLSNRWGVPQVSPTIQTWLGYPPPHHPDLASVPPTPYLGWGISPPQTWDGVTPPPPPASVNRLKILPSPIL